MQATAVSTEFVDLKTRLKKTWMAGNYDRFSRYMENGARDFYERLDAAPGAHFLDVACGSGQLALIAAREGLEVTGVDIARNLVERHGRGRKPRVSRRFEKADAEALPYEDASFDIVASLVGAMFAPRPDHVAQELYGDAAPVEPLPWSIGPRRDSSAKCSRQYRNSLRRPRCPRHTLWGDEATVRERLGEGLSDLSMVRRHYTFSYPFPPSEVVEFFRLYYGPIQQAFASLDETDARKLRAELEALWSAYNRGGEELTVVSSEYLEVIAVKA